MTIFKMEFELLARTLMRQSKYNRSVDNRCFRCKRLNEDVNHVICCSAALSQRKMLVKHFEETVLWGPGICQYTAQKFKAGMNQSLNSESERWEGPIPPTTEVVGCWIVTFEEFVNQTDIGWGQVFRGWISKNWNMAIVAFNKTKAMAGTPAMSNWSECASDQWPMAGWYRQLD
jgi:hypothetical protein